jgi:hypothetical protein
MSPYAALCTTSKTEESRHSHDARLRRGGYGQGERGNGNVGNGCTSAGTVHARTAALIEERAVEPTLGGSAVRRPPSPLYYGVRPHDSQARADQYCEYVCARTLRNLEQTTLGPTPPLYSIRAPRERHCPFRYRASLLLRKGGKGRARLEHLGNWILLRGFPNLGSIKTMIYIRHWEVTARVPKRASRFTTKPSAE